MKTFNLTKKQFDNLAKLDLNSNISCMEGNIRIIPSNNKWVRDTKVLKELYCNSDSNFSNKLNTITTLINNCKTCLIEELVFPEEIASVDNKIIGFISPYVESTNLDEILNNYSVPHSDKLRYLKEIGIIISKLEKVRKYSKLTNFYLGDIHEQNFIVNKKTDKVNVIDLDSAYIGDNKPYPSLYLMANEVIGSMPKKYPRNEFIYIPNANSDLLCYITILLNYIASYPIYRLSINEYYGYIDYLSDIGLNSKLLDAFSKVYLNTDNINPVNYVELIPEDLHKTNYRYYLAQTKKKM